MKPLLTRRRFFTAAGLSAAAGLGAYGYARWVEPHWVSVVRHDLPVRNLPPGLQGRTLAQVSDLHVGPVVDSDYLVAAFRKMNSHAPDLVAITGDFMSCKGYEQVDAVARMLEQGFTVPPLGCFAVLGNHDYGPTWSYPEVADRLTKRLAGLGVQVLRNERRESAGLQVIGLDDLWGGQFRPEVVLPTLGPDSPAVVLCHNPDAVDLPGWDNYHGWVLSGHTHGGQCKPPFLPPPLLPVKNKRYTAGAFDLAGGRHLYINRGLGHLLKARFNARPEITLFRLVTDDSRL